MKRETYEWKPGDPVWMLYTGGRSYTGAYRRAQRTGSIASYSVVVIPPEQQPEVRTRNGLNNWVGGSRYRQARGARTGPRTLPANPGPRP